jgi:tRNA pseudouridine38-40 synthase
MMHNVRLTVSYDGTRYHGFQVQPGLETIQLQLQKAITKVSGESAQIVGSGRTDAGVHARAQVVNFVTRAPIPASRWCPALNTVLPNDIVVFKSEEVDLGFDARKSAKRKTYRYTINNNRYLNPLMKHVELHHPGPLHYEAMKNAVKAIVGEHNFTSFCSVRAGPENHVRTIYEADLSRNCEGLIHLMITGNGFLYHMVRIIIGTLISIGEGKRDSEAMVHILQAKDRTQAGPTAKAHGLTLWEVHYEA